MQPRAGKFSTFFNKASPDVVQSAAIVMESVAAPYGHWAEIANRMHDAEHAGDDTTKPDGRRPTPGPASLAGPAFILCSRVCLADADSSELSHDDRMHDLLVFPARTAGRPGGGGWSIWVDEAYLDQEQPEVTYLGQQPVQSGLIGDRACDDGFFPVAADLEALEPGGPPPVEDALDPDLVARVQAHVPSFGLGSVDLHATNAGRDRRHSKVAYAGGIFPPRRQRAAADWPIREPGPRHRGGGDPQITISPALLVWAAGRAAFFPR